MGFEIGKLTRLALGYSGESETRKIQIDMTAWMTAFVGAVIVVYALRPDRYPYFPAIEMQDNILTWVVDAAEVSVPGKGWAQIAAVDPKTGKEYHSRVVQTEVYKSIEEFQTATASSPAQKWVLQVLNARDEATEAADRAVEAANRAEAAAGGGTSGGTTEVVIPSYWQNHLEERAEDIRVAMAAAGWNKSAFFFYSDAHWDYNNQKSPALLKWLYQNTPINKTNFGGDIINTEGEVASTLDYLWEWRKAIRGLEHHSVPGNHDDGNDPDNRWGDTDVYTFLLAAEETPSVKRGDALYYYIDCPAEKTRYLYLDTATKDGNILNDAAQETWLKETLIATPDNWHIVVTAHIWRVYTRTDGVYTDNGWGMGAKTVLDMCDAYNARTGAYSACTGKVEFCVGGHTHWDADYTSEGGIPVILVETDSKHIRSGLDCAVGTITENSINAIIADYANGIVNVIRIGRGNSRIVQLDGSGSEELPDDGGDDGTGEEEDTTWKDVTLTRVKQTSDDTVALEWSANVYGVTYVVYDNNEEVARQTENTQVVLFGVDAGEHVYTVRPQKSADNLGNMSGALSLTTVASLGYTNILRTCVESDGVTLYNGGYGYKENTRLSTTGENYPEKAENGLDVTGFITLARGDVVRLEDVTFYPGNQIFSFSEDMVGGTYGGNTEPLSDLWAPVHDEAGELVQFTMVSSWSGWYSGYIRFYCTNIDAFSVITVNEEITT